MYKDRFVIRAIVVSISAAYFEQLSDCMLLVILMIVGNNALEDVLTNSGNNHRFVVQFDKSTRPYVGILRTHINVRVSMQSSFSYSAGASAESYTLSMSAGAEAPNTQDRSRTDALIGSFPVRTRRSPRDDGEPVPTEVDRYQKVHVNRREDSSAADRLPARYLGIRRAFGI